MTSISSAPFGAWPSPISAEMVAAGATPLSSVILDGTDIYWLAGRAAEAVHLGKGIIERDIEERVPRLDAPLVLYCGGGYRSALAADNLQKMGYTSVLSMDGGIRAWRERHFPLTRG